MLVLLQRPAHPQAIRWTFLPALPSGEVGLASVNCTTQALLQWQIRQQEKRDQGISSAVLSLPQHHSCFCCCYCCFKSFFFSLILESVKKGETERETSISCSTLLHIHCLILTCAGPGVDGTHNLGTLGWRSNQLNYPARALLLSLLILLFPPPPSTSGNNSPNSFQLRLILPVLGLYINGAITFCVWLLLFTVMSMGFIQVAAYITTSFLFIAETYFIQMTYHNLFDHVLLMDIWVVSRFWQLWIKVLWIFLHKNFDTDFQVNLWVKGWICEDTWTHFTFVI